MCVLRSGVSSSGKRLPLSTFLGAGAVAPCSPLCAALRGAWGRLLRLIDAGWDGSIEFSGHVQEWTGASRNRIRRKGFLDRACACAAGADIAVRDLAVVSHGVAFDGHSLRRVEVLQELASIVEAGDAGGFPRSSACSLRRSFHSRRRYPL